MQTIECVELKGIQFTEMNLNGELELVENNTIPIDYVLAREVRPDLYITLAYPVSAAQKKDNTLFCCFKYSAPEPPGSVSLQISAVSDAIRSIEICPKTQVNFYAENNYFSISPGKSITSSFYTSFVPIPIHLNEIADSQGTVSIKEIELLWQWFDGNSPKEICTTCFRVSFLIAPPTYPWNGTYIICNNFGDGKCQNAGPYVWAPILKWVCCWASGISDANSAAIRIAEALQGRSNQHQCSAPKFIYSITPKLTHGPPGAPNKDGSKWSGALTFVRSYTNKFVGKSVPEPSLEETVGIQKTVIDLPSELIFYGTSMLQYFEGMYGFGNEVNCTDMATMMMYLANALGCTLKVARLLPVKGSIVTKKVLLLGNEKGSPQAEEFAFHDFAYIGNILEPDSILVFDPCFILKDSGAPNSLIGISYSKYKKILFENPGNVMDPVNYSDTCNYCIV